MTPFFLEPGLSVPFWVLLGAFVIGEVVLVVRSRLNRDGRHIGKLSQFATVVAIDGSILAGLAFGVRDLGALPGPWLPYSLGVVLMAIGLTIRQWAVATLGKMFTGDIRIHTRQSVIDRGPYRWVRHPSYSGMIIFLAGLGLGLQSWLSLAVLVALPTTALICRIHIEEQAMLQSAGDGYVNYANHRKRLFPGVW